MKRRLTERELCLAEAWHDPIMCAEALIPENIKAPHRYPSCKKLTYRPYQIAFVDYSYHQMPNPNPEITMQAKVGAGTCYNISARNIGKSFCEIVNGFMQIIHEEGCEDCISSFDYKHLKKICSPIVNLADFHPIYEIFKKPGKKEGITLSQGGMEINSLRGYTLYGKNENVKDPDPGQDFHSLHASRWTIEEHCVDGKTQIRWIDENGENYFGDIAKFINSGLWKTSLVYSYNFKKKKIELKKVINVFQKQVKNYKHWELKVQNYGNRKDRVLKTSQHQKIWTNKGYKEVEELKVGDILYNADYFKLTNLQKQILIGTLLGDSCITKKGTNNHPSLTFTHGHNQFDYLKYKQSCFSNLFRSHHRQKSKLDWNFRKTSYGGNVCTIVTDTCVDLHEFYDFKKNKLTFNLLKKYLSPISLAFWVMDDGTLRQNSGKTEFYKKIRICSHGFSYDSHLNLQKILKQKFDLDVEIKHIKRSDRAYFVLDFDNKNTLKLIDLIKNYIHPTLYYKIYTKCELCHIIAQNQKIKFKNLSKNIKDLLQPVKLLSKKQIFKKSWKMHDIEVADNHNFFASGLLISNSYSSLKGEEKRIDAINSLGCIERFSGIPDSRLGSPLGNLLNDKSKKPWIIRLPQFVREDYSDKVYQEQIKKYRGKSTPAFRLNVLAEYIPGAEGYFDWERIRKNSYNPKKRVKYFEIGKKDFEKISYMRKNDNYWVKFLDIVKQKLILDAIPGRLKICASDIGTTGSSSEICLFFGDDRFLKWTHRIPLTDLTTQEQSRVFYYIYKKLNGCIIALDTTNSDGRSIMEDLKSFGVLDTDLAYCHFKKKINVGFEEDYNGKIKVDEKGRPIIRQENPLEWANSELEKIYYNGLVEIRHEETFIHEVQSYFCVRTGNVLKFGSSTTNHILQSHQCMALARFWNETKKVGSNNENIYAGGF